MKRIVLLCSAAVLLSAPIFAQTVSEKPLSSAPVPTVQSKQAPVPQSPSTPAVVACDAICVRNSADIAVRACAPQIEAQAPGDYEWLYRPYGGIFQEADTPEEKSPTVVRYRGDSIRFLSPQKEWVRAIYECGFDAAKQQVAYVRVQLGVRGKASAVPVLPSPPQAQAQAQAPKAAPGTAAKGQAPAPAAPAAGAPTSDRRKVGEVDDVSVLQVKPPKGGR